MNLDQNILDKAKPYFPAQKKKKRKKSMLYHTEKYDIIFSTENLLNKHNEPISKCS